MVNYNYNLVSMPFTISCCCSFFPFMFFIFYAPNKVKRTPFYQNITFVVFLHCAVSYFGSVLWLNIN